MSKAAALVVPDVAEIDTLHAQLPVLYEQAKSSLASCERLDECKEWADKAAALASYAKQADDQELSNLASRIRARAFRRMSDLLETFQNKTAGLLRGDSRTVVDNSTGSQRSIAKANGITPQQERMIREIGKIPQKDFDEKMESKTPPKITQLATYGRTGKIEPKMRQGFQINSPRRPIAQPVVGLSGSSCWRRNRVAPRSTAGSSTAGAG